MVSCVRHLCTRAAASGRVRAVRSMVEMHSRGGIRARSTHQLLLCARGCPERADTHTGARPTRSRFELAEGARPISLYYHLEESPPPGTTRADVLTINLQTRTNGS
jgi:hypothetical protein